MKQTASATAQPLRGTVLQAAAVRFGAEPEYLWRAWPDYAVLRRPDSRKWFAVLMVVPKERLGLSGGGAVEILNVKCDPVLAGSLRQRAGILPAYHMSRENWLSVLLDGTVEEETVLSLLDMSFALTGKGSGGRRTGENGWIVPANPRYFDVEQAFAQNDIILWKQSGKILKGDAVYLYVAAPRSAILYRCRAVEVNIPYRYDDGKVRISRAMKIQLLHRFEPDCFTRRRLKQHGVCAVRAPRGVPESLRRELEAAAAE